MFNPHRTHPRIHLTNQQQVDPGVRFPSGPLHVFLHKETMDVRDRYDRLSSLFEASAPQTYPSVPSTHDTKQAVKLRFDYLTNKPKYLDEAKNILERPVSYLKFNVVDVNASLAPDDIPIQWCASVKCVMYGDRCASFVVPTLE